jgi:hypothetical protein
MSTTDGGVAFLANGQVTTVSSQLLIANPETMILFSKVVIYDCSGAGCIDKNTFQMFMEYLRVACADSARRSL